MTLRIRYRCMFNRQIIHIFFQVVFILKWRFWQALLRIQLKAIVHDARWNKSSSFISKIRLRVRAITLTLGEIKYYSTFLAIKQAWNDINLTHKLKRWYNQHQTMNSCSEFIVYLLFLKWIWMNTDNKYNYTYSCIYLHLITSLWTSLYNGFYITEISWTYTYCDSEKDCFSRTTADLLICC